LHSRRAPGRPLSAVELARRAEPPQAARAIYIRRECKYIG